MELTITKERVLEAAKTSLATRQLLECLFPEAFEINKEIIPVITANVNGSLNEKHQMASDVAIHDKYGINNEPAWLIAVEGNRIALSPWYKWEMNERYLIPSHKED